MSEEQIIRLPFAIVHGPDVEKLRDAPEALNGLADWLANFALGASDEDFARWGEALHRYAEIITKVVETYGAPMEPVDPEEFP